MSARMENRGGEYDSVDAPGLLASPIEERIADYQAALIRAAEGWAPGTASAEWDNWPEEPTSDSQMPGLLRIGSEPGSGLPVLTPAVGEAHLMIGNPDLTKPIVVTPVVTSMNMSEANKEKAAAKARERRQNKVRLDTLADERNTAITVASGLMTRAVGSLRPGSLDLTVYDPHDRGRAFTGFSPLASSGRYNVYGPGGLSALLEELDSDIMTRQQTHLAGFPTMRQLMEETGAPAPVPWRMVALMGNGERLEEVDQERLDHIVRNGVQCGISVIMHGFSAAPQDTLHHVQLLPQGQATTATFGPVAFNLDSRPPSAVTRRTTLAAVRELPAAESTAPIPQDELNTRPPGESYRTYIGRRRDALTSTIQATTAYENQFPYLGANYLSSEVLPSIPAYQEFAAAAAQDHKLALARAREALGIGAEAGATDIATQMQAWAMLDLLRSAPGHGWKDAEALWVSLTTHGGYGAAVLPQIEQAAQLVRVTAQHGQEDIPEFIRPYITQRLPDNPPAWAFQVVADRALHPPKVRLLPKPPRALDAVCYDLEQTYGVTLRDERGRVADKALVECLAECRLLDLYDFANADEQREPLRVLLTRRAHRRLEQVDQETVPEAARATYDACLAHLEEIGGRIPTTREKVSGYIGSAVSSLANLGKKDAETPDGEEVATDKE